MFGMLLIAFEEYILAPARIVGLAMIAVGIAIALLAKRLTRVIKKQSEVDKSDRTFVTILTVALVIILCGMIVCCFQIIKYFYSKKYPAKSICWIFLKFVIKTEYIKL